MRQMRSQAPSSARRTATFSVRKCTATQPVPSARSCARAVAITSFAFREPSSNSARRDARSQYRWLMKRESWSGTSSHWSLRKLFAPARWWRCAYTQRRQASVPTAGRSANRIIRRERSVKRPSQGFQSFPVPRNTRRAPGRTTAGACCRRAPEADRLPRPGTGGSGRGRGHRAGGASPFPGWRESRLSRTSGADPAPARIPPVFTEVETIQHRRTHSGKAQVG